MEVLSAEILASSRAKECEQPYRAVLIPAKLGAVIRIEQPIGEKWHPTGCGWYISSLLKGGVSDSIDIDFGQQWKVDSGMVAAIDEALLLLANQHTTEV